MYINTLMKDYILYKDIKDNLILNIDEKKSDATILSFIRLNMNNHKIVLSDLDEYYINFLTKLCTKYNLKYEIIGYNKKLLIINNTPHKYLNIETKIPSIPSSKTRMGYTYLKHKTKIDKSITNNRHFTINSIREDIYEENSEDDNEKYAKKDTEEDIEENIEEDTEENTEEDTEEDSEDDTEEDTEEDTEKGHSMSSSSYINEAHIKNIVIDYNNIFTKGETVLYLLSNVNLVCNMIIMYKLFIWD